MRTKGAIGIVVLILVILVAIRVISVKPQAGPWPLAGGAKLSLAGVTYGKNHTMRYGNSVADYLYPVLSSSLRKKLGCKVSTFSTVDSNAVVIWFWDRAPYAVSQTFFQGAQYTIFAVDDLGLESEMLAYAKCSVVWRKTNLLQGWELKHFPRRSQNIGIRIYCPTAGLNSEQRLVGEFKIPNPFPTNFPAWAASPLPVNIVTNSLEISLVRFETGLREDSMKRFGPPTRNYTLAEFCLRMRRQISTNWTIRRVFAKSPSGDLFEPMLLAPLFNDREGAHFLGTFWPEEPTWKLNVEVWRTADFPAEELWTIKGIPIPTNGNTSEMGLTTNIYGSEIVFMGLSAARTNAYNPGFGQHITSTPPTLRIISPLPSIDTHIRLVSARDNEDRDVQVTGTGRSETTGGRGATIRQVDEIFTIKIPEGAKTLDVTFAYTKSIFVEFFARPKVAESAAGK